MATVSADKPRSFNLDDDDCDRLIQLKAFTGLPQSTIIRNLVRAYAAGDIVPPNMVQIPKGRIKTK